MKAIISGGLFFKTTMKMHGQYDTDGKSLAFCLISMTLGIISKVKTEEWISLITILTGLTTVVYNGINIILKIRQYRKKQNETANRKD